MTHQEFCFGDIELIDLRCEADGIAAGAEFIAKIAHARRRNGNLVRRHRIFGRNHQERVENVALAFLEEGGFLAIDNDAHVFFVLAQTEAFVHHQGRIAAATVREACGFKDCLCSELLAERKRGVAFSGESDVDTVGTGFVSFRFGNVPNVRCHFDPLV